MSDSTPTPAIVPELLTTAEAARFCKLNQRILYAVHARHE